MIREGDRDSTYFHLSTIIKRNNRKIIFIKYRDNNISTDPVIPRKHDTLSSPSLEYSLLQSGLLPLGRERKKPNLSSNPSTILRTIPTLSEPPSMRKFTRLSKNVGVLKAPGLDGFLAIFFQEARANIHKDILTLVQNFV